MFWFVSVEKEIRDRRRTGKDVRKKLKNLDELGKHLSNIIDFECVFLVPFVGGAR